jgi:FixJ family two-component response regulator
MPGMSGRELAGRIRRIAPAARVVFMSGYTNDVQAPAGALEPGIFFLQKPLRPDALAAGVREALDSPFQPFNPL